jgi:DnaK suppressor protein
MIDNLEAVRTGLLQRRDELLALGKAAAESRRPVELDQTTVGRLSRMDAMQVQAMAIEAERRRSLELRRIDEDEYGYCVRCGEAIAAKRLALDPTTPTCIGCAGTQGTES